jgi:chromosomal replication initiator protein
LAGDQHLEQTWAGIQRHLRAAFPDSIYEIWLAGLEPVALKTATLYLQAPDHTRQWVRRRFRATIESIASSIDPGIQRIELVESAKELERTAATSMTAGRSDSVDSLKPTYTFDSFVIGESNRFAHAAALAVAETPGQAYNPLFIHGPPGVGKTHLLQAIGNYIALYDASLRVHYTTVEAFTNEFMGALQGNDLGTFKSRYRRSDVLLVDDVQFLEGKQKTAEEFFHTLDAVLAGGAQAVLSGDRYPTEITALDPRLRERFQSGLIVDLALPNHETRLVMLRKLAASSPSAVEPGVLEHMAAKISSNVRVLEGAFIRVVAFASLVESQVSTDLTDRVLADLYGQPSPGSHASDAPPSIPRIQKETAALFSLDPSVLCSPSRRRDVVYARQVAMYLSRELTNKSLPAIGIAFDGRDHTTVLHAHRKITKQLLRDSDTRSVISNLRNTLQLPPQSLSQPRHPETPRK